MSAVSGLDEVRQAAQSALALVTDPAVLTGIARHDPKIRADLLVVRRAEAAGWRVMFLNDDWHHAAFFQRGAVSVWSSGRDFRAVRRGADVTYDAVIFPFNEAGLLEALGLRLP